MKITIYRRQEVEKMKREMRGRAQGIKKRVMEKVEEVGLGTTAPPPEPVPQADGDGGE